jgi:elongator complex protein 3
VAEAWEKVPEIKDAAFIRELHTYGHLVPISQKNSGAAQHKGLGKKLMAQAEEIARQAGYRKMAVISGVGVRGYYRKLGYRLQGTYMVKSL